MNEFVVGDLSRMNRIDLVPLIEGYNLVGSSSLAAKALPPPACLQTPQYAAVTYSLSRRRPYYYRAKGLN